MIGGHSPSFYLVGFLTRKKLDKTVILKQAYKRKKKTNLGYLILFMREKKLVWGAAHTSRLFHKTCHHGWSLPLAPAALVTALSHLRGTCWHSPLPVSGQKAEKRVPASSGYEVLNCCCVCCRQRPLAVDGMGISPRVLWNKLELRKFGEELSRSILFWDDWVALVASYKFL